MIYKIPIEIFETNDGGCHLLIKAFFSKSENGWLIIDTGANKTVFDETLVSKYVQKIEKIDEEIAAGINASIENSYKVTLPFLKLNEFHLHNFETVIINLDYLNNIYRQVSDKKIWGLIGGDFLLKHNCKINYKTKKLSIKLKK